MHRSLLFIVLISSFFISCKTVPVTGRKQLNIVPDFMIKELAFSEYDSIVKVSRTLPAQDERAAMVTRIGTRIQKAVELYMQQNNFQKDLKHLSWEFNTIDENIVNAWCMPGGKVVVYTGLLPVTQNETALAFVMGHEIAHAIARHGNERMSQGLLVNLGGLVLQEALKEKKKETQVLFLGLYMIGSNLAYSLPNSRLQESEADKLGLIFMSMAGYDPTESVALWQRMSQANGKTKTPEFLSTHPSDETRMKNLAALIPDIKAKYYKGDF
ncbi:M48 family metallopeptidase [Pseudobacter ginsenosidimutans]|uniref:Peptidase M48-like protein n=1 Tax=Pseudobacter ginsenosidimutans TaxID=661488 RepID=A0A4Q7MS23_9BACT|nr:M48 family metallopeptidase [Pseudobacter ginsenosidimutans]QEC42488.1 M48 family metallopeptidase [Pseudobacter ginsenosidimutans]RZS70659.1 peptidase M48-like protein [Pseudobacter ginsenosidimutans]